MTGPASSNGSITTLFFDLDDTVYSPACGLWEQIGGRINLFMRERMQFPAAEIDSIRIRLFKTYGTTLRGLKTEYGIDEHDYLDFVHDVPLADHISPDPAVRAAILRYPHKKIIFTNADSHHARRVLHQVGLEDCFDQVVDILDIWPYCKPMPEAFDIALQKAGSPDPSTCVFIDDQPHNLISARAAGFRTILVSERHAGHPEPVWDACIPSLAALPSALDPIIHPDFKG